MAVARIAPQFLLERLKFTEQLLTIRLCQLSIGADLALEFGDLLLGLGQSGLDSLTFSEHPILGIGQNKEQQASKHQGRKRPQERAACDVQRQLADLEGCGDAPGVLLLVFTERIVGCLVAQLKGRGEALAQTKDVINALGNATWRQRSKKGVADHNERPEEQGQRSPKAQVRDGVEASSHSDEGGTNSTNPKAAGRQKERISEAQTQPQGPQPPPHQVRRVRSLGHDNLFRQLSVPLGMVQSSFTV